MAYAQYSAGATGDEISSWYSESLVALGYREWLVQPQPSDSVTKYAAAFFLPTQPLVTVEVHTSDSSTRNFPTVFELIVTHRAPSDEYDLPEEIVPRNTQRVQVKYFLDQSNEVPDRTMVVDDPSTVRRLVETVNRMPVRANWVQFGCSDSGSAAEVKFTRGNEDSVIIRETAICSRFHVYAPGLPPLEDAHLLLWEAIEEIVGLQPEPAPTFVRLGPTPTPVGLSGTP